MSGRDLAKHRVDAHDGAFNAQHIQELRDGYNLVGLRVYLRLPQYQTLLGGKSGKHVNGVARAFLLERAPGSLAIDGDDLRRYLGDRRNLVHQSERRLRRSLVKSMHKQRASALTYESFECVSALGDKAALEDFRIEHREYLAKPVMRRGSIAAGQEAAEQMQLFFAE